MKILLRGKQVNKVPRAAKSSSEQKGLTGIQSTDDPNFWDRIFLSNRKNKFWTKNSYLALKPKTNKTSEIIISYSPGFFYYQLFYWFEMATLKSGSNIQMHTKTVFRSKRIKLRNRPSFIWTLVFSSSIPIDRWIWKLIFFTFE